MSSAPYMILNGEIVAEEEALFSPLNRGMMYGDGCFETLRFYSGKLLRWQKHFDRLNKGLHYLGMEAEFSSAELKEWIFRLAEKNQLSDTDALARIQCWRKGGRGYKPASSEFNWMLQVTQISPRNESLNLMVAKTRCIPERALSRQFKLSNGLNYVKAAQEANAENKDDALMLTIEDKVSETTSANIFWIKNNSVFTPGKGCDLLPGITRSIILEVCKELDISVTRGSYDKEELFSADAIFGTNSIREIIEIATIEDMEFQLGHPMLNKIKAGFKAYKRKHLER